MRIHTWSWTISVRHYNTLHGLPKNLSTPWKLHPHEISGRHGNFTKDSDIDFGELIARSKARLLSIIIFRLRNMSPEKVNLHLHEIISKHQDALQQGVIISVTEGQIRVRLLPIETTK